MFERFAGPARAVVEDAGHEAARRGDRRIGTDHLLVALLRDEGLARIVGADPAAAREAADQLDRDALAAIGLTVHEFQPAGQAALGRRMPLTSGAKSVIQGALANTVAEKARAISSRHLLLALLDRHEPDPAATLLTALAVDQPTVRKHLTASAWPSCPE
jgi:ATP-dependent Clp protease ATP-binding subunit ClpA